MQPHESTEMSDW